MSMNGIARTKISVTRQDIAVCRQLRMLPRCFGAQAGVGGGAIFRPTVRARSEITQGKHVTPAY
ncbi:hypothetical protein [Paraburkholderia solisilvae]|uniref:Uncharacterized protein n=2 Tax=Paraburkholderia solisilvae TaxID=624376 RepID=A0A6J5DLI6_9BURK|nr:hypothetical protein [Paraburkholderia solisilvae]CAB3753875.1 hypothetical protein LMG29739_01809 [Paraburkholderia solisilvae]